MAQSGGKPTGASAKKSETKSLTDDQNKGPETRASARRKTSASSVKKTRKKTSSSDEKDSAGWRKKLGGITNSAFNIARRTTGGSIKVGKKILKNQEQLRVMVAAGESLKDLREVAGLTISEMSEAINLKDKSLLEAVEDGTSTLSFELILRLAALLARNDPIPFIIKYTRTYNPDVWRILDDWGLGRIPLHYERERNFINIYRRHDAARSLSDEGFDKVLKFTNNAFEMALHFIAESENIKIEKTEIPPEKDEFQKQNKISKSSEHKTNSADKQDQWKRRKSNSADQK